MAAGRSMSVGRWRPRHWRSLAITELGCVMAAVAAGPWLQPREMANLVDHMIAHVVLMFLVPIAWIYGGAGRLWWWALPVAPRRRFLRAWYRLRRPSASPSIAGPAAATLTLNLVMVVSHLPRVFDDAMVHTWSMDWLVEPAFVASGLWFFSYLVASPPRQLRTRLRVQLAMVVLTMVEMLVLAMSMSIFTKQQWYLGAARAMASMGGLAGYDFHSQQVAAGVLWICGDFWAIPILAVILRRAARRDGGVLGALERQLSFG
jgi:cytochrome c oxidase assembly factor CtaG